FSPRPEHPYSSAPQGRYESLRFTQRPDPRRPPQFIPSAQTKLYPDWFRSPADHSPAHHQNLILGAGPTDPFSPAGYLAAEFMLPDSSDPSPWTAHRFLSRSLRWIRARPVAFLRRRAPLPHSLSKPSRVAHYNHGVDAMPPARRGVSRGKRT